MPIENAGATMKLGYVEEHGVRLEMSLVVNADRTAALQVWMCDTHSRRTGELMLLTMNGALELKELIGHAERTVGSLTGSQQIAGLAVRR